MSATGLRPTIAHVLARHRVVVCVGTGGVGKTTIAAALALCGAMSGRRSMVLTIDPARQLARALGLHTLRRGGECVASTVLASAGLSPAGSLHAGMLDQKAAWDAFVSRHAPSLEVRDALLDNAFYQQLSTSLAGSTEYMAIEELCRLDESGRYDLIVIDTPPAGHAVDFLRAPERIDRLLDPEVTSWVSRPYRALGRGAFRALSATARHAVRQVERAAGTQTLREISAFFVALDALFGDVAGRAARARALLCGEGTAFVLVAGPSERVLAEGDALMATIAELRVPLRATVINRVHRPPGELPASAGLAITPERRRYGSHAIDPVLRELAEAGVDTAVRVWLRESWDRAVLTAQVERERLVAFAHSVPRDSAWVEVPELDRDAHSLSDLAEVVGWLGASGQE